MSLKEKLAALEHAQWTKWSQDIAERETLSPETLERWAKYWIPYDDLPEAVKEKDREWATHVWLIVEQYFPPSALIHVAKALEVYELMDIGEGRSNREINLIDSLNKILDGSINNQEKRS